MTLLTSARLGAFAWSWRRPLLTAVAACLLVPLVIAGMVVQAGQGGTGGLLPPGAHATITQRFGCTTLEIEPWSAQCARPHFHSGVDPDRPLRTPLSAPP